MENSFSKDILDQYLLSVKSKVRFILKNGRQISGYIVGYYYNDIETDTVFQWHIGAEFHKNSIAVDPYHFLIGQHILQKDIASVYFFESKIKIDLK